MSIAKEGIEIGKNYILNFNSVETVNLNLL